jgi:hypothetical protein
MLDQRTKEFEAGRERLSALNYEALRLTTEAMFERQKCGGLVHEFSVQRNVHRWDIMAAVDPTYVKQLKYRCQLTSKLDASHRELIDLIEEKRKLQEKVTKTVASASKSSKVSVEEQMAVYAADIAKKEEQIEGLRRQVDENRPNMHSSMSDVAAVHEKVVMRRGNCAKLRTQSVAAMRPAGEDAVWFITEAPMYRIRGGGFVSRGVRVKEGEALVSLSAEAEGPGRRAKSMLNAISNSKKVTKPVAGPVSPSPKKSLTIAH